MHILLIMECLGYVLLYSLFLGNATFLSESRMTGMVLISVNGTEGDGKVGNMARLGNLASRGTATSCEQENYRMNKLIFMKPRQRRRFWTFCMDKTLRLQRFSKIAIQRCCPPNNRLITIGVVLPLKIVGEPLARVNKACLQFWRVGFGF